MSKKKKQIESEFGSGFIYSLILFAKHAFMYTHFAETLSPIRKELHQKPEDKAATLFFYGADDHLIDLQIPDKYKGTKIGFKVKDFVEFVHARRLGFDHTEKDYLKCFEMLEEIVMLIDKDMGIKPIKAQWN
jgi:hypothetical protein